jgi:dTDP-4-dehydrorhamnose reductase
MGAYRSLNKKMRVVVTGASGFIGKAFLDAFSHHNTTGLCLTRSRPGLIRMDLRDRGRIRALLAEIRPEVVIHCAARPSVDWCELHSREARELNVVPTILLAQECANLGAAFVFLSTDYVFDGTNGPYYETDATNPINIYGRLKLEAEEAVRRLSGNHLIVRTTNVYGFDPESKNFLMAILPQLERGERVTVAEDQIGNPTLVSDLCSVVRELVLKECVGTFHVAGPDLMNRLEWLLKAVWAFGLDPTLVSGVLTSDLNQPAPRPRKSGLVSTCLDSLVHWRPLGLEAGLRLMKRDWDDYYAGLQDEDLALQGVGGNMALRSKD